MSESRKRKLVEDLARFYQFKHIPFDKPRYKKQDKLPFIPTEQEIDALIAGNGKKTATMLQLLKETGMRVGEAWNLRWKDIDYEKNSVNILPEKNSDARQLKISSRLAAMLNNLPRKHEMVFRDPAVNPIESMEHFRRNFIKRRMQIAKNLQNPRINAIKFHTLRHYKGTTEYCRTKDILHVKQLLGHKSILNTMRYMHLVTFEPEDNYVCKIAKTVKEAQELVESGFDYVCDVEDYKLFRKRK